VQEVAPATDVVPAAHAVHPAPLPFVSCPVVLYVFAGHATLVLEQLFPNAGHVQFLYQETPEDIKEQTNTAIIIIIMIIIDEFPAITF
jgi:hypothetical protein